MTITTKPRGKSQDPQIHTRTPKPRNDSHLQISLHSQFLLRQKERWQTPSCTGLSPTEQVDEEE